MVAAPRMHGQAEAADAGRAWGVVRGAGGVQRAGAAADTVRGRRPPRAAGCAAAARTARAVHAGAAACAGAVRKARPPHTPRGVGAPCGRRARAGLEGAPRRAGTCCREGVAQRLAGRAGAVPAMGRAGHGPTCTDLGSRAAWPLLLRPSSGPVPMRAPPPVLCARATSRGRSIAARARRRRARRPRITAPTAAAGRRRAPPPCLRNETSGTGSGPPSPALPRPRARRASAPCAWCVRVGQRRERVCCAPRSVGPTAPPGRRGTGRRAQRDARRRSSQIHPSSAWPAARAPGCRGGAQHTRTRCVPCRGGYGTRRASSGPPLERSICGEHGLLKCRVRIRRARRIRVCIPVPAYEQ